MLLLKIVFRMVKLGGTSSSNIKNYYDGNIPFLSISDMTSQRKYILKTEKSISQQELEIRLRGLFLKIV